VKRRLLLRAIACCAGVAGLLKCAPLWAAQYGRRAARLGLVGANSSATAPKSLTAFWDRLRELGYVEGDNLIVERRWADGQLSRLPALMDDLVMRKVDVIFTSGTPAAVAAKQSTSRIPIVVSAMGDPLGTGLVASLANP